MSEGSGVDPELSRRVATEARRVLATNRRTGTSRWDGMHYDFVVLCFKQIGQDLGTASLIESNFQT